MRGVLRFVRGFFVALSSLWVAACRPSWGASVDKFRDRLTQARDGSGPEVLLEGRVQRPERTLRSPLAGRDAIGFATWNQIRRGSPTYDNRNQALDIEGFRLEGVPFDLDTESGVVRVEGPIVGLTDLERRTRGPVGAVEAVIAPGDHVSVLGRLSERNGDLGFYDEVIVAKGTFEEFYDGVQWGTLPSIPVRPWPPE